MDEIIETDPDES
jgi:hypothetical protein